MLKWIKYEKSALLQKYLILIVGAFLMAIAINMVYEPIGMVTGGVSGLGIVVKKLTEEMIEGGFPVWAFNLICNVPLFLIAIKVKGKGFIISSLIGMVAFSVSLMIVPIYDFKFDDMLLTAIVGGAISGAGMGLIFHSSASTGGTDLMASVIQHFNKHISIPRILYIIDAVIIVVGALVFGVGTALYAIIAVFISTKVSDSIMEGMKFAKVAYIISDEYAKIAELIMVSVDRGVTGINATGMYSNTDKKMLFCVVSKKEIVNVIEIAKTVDKDCFIIVSDAREVMGEGFIEYRQ